MEKPDQATSTSVFSTLHGHVGALHQPILNGEIILCDDFMTGDIKKFLAVTEYRRQKQLGYNKEHDITPRSVSRAVEESPATYQSSRKDAHGVLNDANMGVDLAANCHTSSRS